MDQTHIQCLLTKDTSYGERVQVTWLPSKFAKLGKIVKLKNIWGDWEDGWAVTERYGQQPTETVLDRRNDHMRQREMSDI